MSAVSITACIVNMNLHVFRSPTAKKYIQRQETWLAPSPLAEAFHVYGLEWDENSVKFYFDGALVRSETNTHWHQALTLNFDSETMPDWFGLPESEGVAGHVQHRVCSRLEKTAAHRITLAGFKQRK